MIELNAVTPIGSVQRHSLGAQPVDSLGAQPVDSLGAQPVGCPAGGPYSKQQLERNIDWRALCRSCGAELVSLREQ